MQHDVSCEKPRKDDEGQCSSNQLGIFIAFYKQFDFNAMWNNVWFERLRCSDIIKDFAQSHYSISV